jgi:hypothetical protein
VRSTRSPSFVSFSRFTSAADRHDIAFDRNLDFVLVDARDLRLDDVRGVGLDDINFDGRGGLLDADRAEEAANELVESVVRVV